MSKTKKSSKSAKTAEYKPVNNARKHCFLTEAEEKLSNNSTEASITTEIQKIQDSLPELERRVDACSFKDENELLAKYHPEVKELIQNPEFIPDPNDMINDAIFCCQSPKLRPRTNEDKYKSIQSYWVREEFAKTKEYKKYKKEKDLVWDAKAKIRSLEHKLQELRSVRSIIAIPNSKTPSRLIDVLSKLLKDADMKEKGKIDALLIPYDNVEGKCVAVNVSKEHYKFKPFEVWVLREGTSKSSDVVAVISDDTVYWRQDLKEKQNILNSLDYLSKNPIDFFTVYGKKLGSCLLCGRVLSREDSIGMGYGKTCAKYMQLL
jgi:hypothetical protein